MQDWLTARANATPNKIALIHDPNHWTWAELHRLTMQLCAKLKEIGLRPGGKVALLMTNSIEAVVSIHAVARLGCILVPLNTRLTSEEMNWQLAHTTVRLLLYSAETSKQAATLNPNRFLVSLNDLPNSNYPESPVDLSAIQSIVFTSGTTGQPKGAEITFGNHFYSATASAFRLGHQPSDIWLSVLPLYHVGGLAVIFRCTLYGITTLLHGRFDANEIDDSFRLHPVTLISLVPTMLYRLLNASVGFPKSLRLILLGGAAATPDLMDRAAASNLPIATTYGLTEASSQVATMLPEDTAQKPGSVGRALMFTTVQILAEDGTLLPPNEYGEIVVSGPTVMRGYHRNPEATAKTLRHGMLHTGDIGYLDDDGDLWLVQRRSDLIVSGGENVYPAEVERVILTHPAVSAVAVVGLTNPEWGQQVAAAVVLGTGTHLTKETLQSYCREHLATYKIPRRVVFTDHLPQTASGKIQREGIRRLFEEG